MTVWDGGPSNTMTDRLGRRTIHNRLGRRTVWDGGPSNTMTDRLGRRTVQHDGLRHGALLHAVLYDQRRFRQRVRLHRVGEDLLRLHDDSRL